MNQVVVAPTPVSGALVGQVLGGKFRLLRLLGAGGVGEVYAAEHLVMKAPVAIKILHAGLSANEHQVERFRREAKSALLLDHPHVVRVLDFDCLEDRFCLVMEWIEGDPLSTWLRRPELPSQQAVVAILLGLSSALETAHALGIVHRDLSPRNVLVTRNSTADEPFVKIVDFGLAHLEEENAALLTVTDGSLVAGTPAYMSPEQCRSIAVGPETDVYALGCVLTELLQGAPPFVSPSRIEVMSQHLLTPPPPLDRPPTEPPVPAMLAGLRMRMLAKTPAERPTATEVRDIVSALAAELGVPTPPRPRTSSQPPAAAMVTVPLERAEAPAPLAEAPTASSTPAAHHVGFGSTVGGPAASTPALIAALARHGLAPVPYDVHAPTAVAAVVLDAGDDLMGAAVALGKLAADANGPAVIVRVGGLSVPHMRDLVVAGATDLIARDASDDDLAAKLATVIARREATG